jgi:chromosomal replication initiation ATPase DnaA
MATKRRDLSSLAKRVCKAHEVSIGELRSGSRRHEIVEARRVFSWLAVKELGYSGAEVARYLGVTTSCVTRAASSGGEPDKKIYLSK